MRVHAYIFTLRYHTYVYSQRIGRVILTKKKREFAWVEIRRHFLSHSDSLESESLKNKVEFKLWLNSCFELNMTRDIL